MEVTVVEKSLKSPQKNMDKWHRFQIVSPTRAIIQGSYSINDKHFKILSRGRQASATAAVAIVYAHLLEPRNWTRSFIDQVLEDGDRLFRISQAHNRLKDDVYMTPSLLEEQFFVGDYKCKICIEVGVVCGNVASEAVGALNLKHGLRIFLNAPNFGILTSQEMSVAIWNQHCGYFYFDPAPVDEKGKRNNSGFACIIRAKDIDSIYKIFMENLRYKSDSRYFIDKISVMKIEAINRGKYGCRNVGDIMVNKKITSKSTNFQSTKPDCPKTDKLMDSSLKDTKIVQEFIRKIPLMIEMTNDAIEAKIGQVSIIDQNLLDNRFTYDEMKVNVPSSFKTIATDPEIKILRGLTHDASDIYKAKGSQTVANCIMAIAMKKIHPVKTWLRKTLDDILSLGDAIYEQVKTEKSNIITMTAIDLDDTRFKLEDNKMIIDVDLLTVVGTVISKVSTVLNLKQGLEEFFINNFDGILECSSMIAAIWMQENYYYLFDSRACDMTGLHLIVEEKGKKGNEDLELAEKRITGKCCVLRFITLNSLYEHLLKNLDFTKFKYRFTIRRIDIIKDLPGIRDWYSFRPAVIGKSWILRGSINSDNETFEEHSRGVQDLAISVITLIAAKTIAPSNWSKEDVDVAIREGDAYYNWCVPPIGESDDDRKMLSIKNLKKYLYYKKCKVLIEVKESYVIGYLKVSLDDNLKNLGIAISNFFENYQFGVLEINNKYFAIWKFENELIDKSMEVGYYLFCDKPWSNFLQEIQTESNNVEEFACVLRFLNHAEILITLKDFLEVEEEPSKASFFIHEIKVASITEPLTDEEIEIDKTKPIKPELRSYTAVGENGAFLTGSFNQTNEILFKKETRNKQQAANALVTLSMTKLFDPHLWYMEVLDDILKMGDKLSDKSSKNLMDSGEDDTENARYYLLPSEINHNFFLGINQITINIEEEAITGHLNELTKSLEDFFNNNKMGVFRQEQTMLAIWKEENSYFTMNPRGQKNGNAIVYWYIDISSLAEILLECLEKSEGDFIIDGVSIENNYSITEKITEDYITANKWYNFSKIEEGIWKINCTITMTDEMFQKENQGNQSAAICIMAIVFSKVYELRYWSSEILDEIIITGDILHSRSVARLGENKSFQSNEIINEFFIANRRIDLSIHDCVQCGTINNQNPKIEVLISHISNFFEKSSSGCVTLSGYINWAIWAYDNYFYYFKPGYCLMRFENVIKLAKQIITNVRADTDFIISSIDVLDWNKLPPWTFDPSSAIRPSNLPPLNTYCRLSGKARAILRGFTHQASEIFSENVRGRQTAANCIICLAMSVIKNSITWTRKTLDEVLAIGANLHCESLKYTNKITTLEPKDIIRIFHIGVNVLAADVEKATVTGIVANRPPEPDDEGKNAKKTKKTKSIKDKKSNKEKQVLSSLPSILLKEGLKTFFENNNAGILVTGRYMVAIWINNGVYFMYDPRSRNHEGLKNDENNQGTSCVVWFACIEPLFDLLSTNINDDEKFAKFEICRVIIKTVSIKPLPSPIGYKIISKKKRILKEESVCLSPTEILRQQSQHPLNMDIETSFKYIDNESSVLLGSSHMSKSCFPAENRGFQSSAIAVVAVVVAALHAPSTWTSDLINATLKYGDILHTECVRHLRSGSRTLSLSELFETFIVGDVRARIRLYRNITAGITLEHDLVSSLELFFASNPFGIMHTTNYVIPLMKHWGKFYFFDPSERNGFKGSFKGAACLIRCENIAKLARFVLQVCAFTEPAAYTLSAIQILDLHFFTQ